MKNNDKLKKFLDEMSKISTKEKRKMLCRELLKHKKIKEYIRLKRASDVEVEQVFIDLYSPFIENLSPEVINE